MSRRRIDNTKPVPGRVVKRFPIPLQDPELAAIAEQSAVGMLQVILDDQLTVMRNAEYHPDARLAAKRVCKNLLLWNGGAGPLNVTQQDMVDIHDKLRIAQVN